MLTGWYNQVTIEFGDAFDHFTYRIGTYNGEEISGKGGCSYIAIGH